MMNSLGVVLGQEMDRFNKLLKRISSTCHELKKAIKGTVVMSAELEQMFDSLRNNKLPGLWEKVAYPSLKPLGSWIKDFLARMDFMNSWLTEGEPKTFALPFFFFPQGFMTGALQNHARKTMIAIDRLNFGFEVMKEWGGEEIAERPADGIYVTNLYLDGAKWDASQARLVEADPGVMYGALPVIHFIPVENYVEPAEEYQCPLYKTSVRAGVLSTTGASTNYVLSISLPIAEHTNPDFWILQGVAALCNLND